MKNYFYKKITKDEYAEFSASQILNNIIYNASEKKWNTGRDDYWDTYSCYRLSIQKCDYAFATAVPNKDHFEFFDIGNLLCLVCDDFFAIFENDEAGKGALRTLVPNSGGFVKFILIDSFCKEYLLVYTGNLYKLFYVKITHAFSFNDSEYEIIDCEYDKDLNQVKLIKSNSTDIYINFTIY